MLLYELKLQEQKLLELKLQLQLLLLPPPLHRLHLPHPEALSTTTSKD